MNHRDAHKREGRQDRPSKGASLWIETLASVAFIVAMVAMLIVTLAMGV